MPSLRPLVRRLTSDHSVRFWTVIGGVVALLTLVVTVGGYLVRTAVGTSQSREPAVAAPTAKMSTVGPPITLASTTPSSEPTPRAPASRGPAPVPLKLDDRVSFEACTAGWFDGPIMIAGTRYDYGFAPQCNGGVEQPASMDFLVPSGSKTLVGIVGITDNSPNTQAKFTFS